ncbi:discoidin domain-containing protein [Cellulosimicrobium arenosum]|uniref:Discoidin domain-containing protein n=1 Tax=Cellulosimicrobium arenosum TaxID=2708133 RepID=A0A927G7L4_9MICO|nr:discoidin domain-containing protein [Cellulosimicrobium arenosum]MBD8078389.1 discoidin domain-containing protein [Cellulosimicrobium arenosum]
MRNSKLYRGVAATSLVTLGVSIFVLPAAADDAGPGPTPTGASPASVVGFDDFPAAPEPWGELDWRQRALDYDAYAYDWTDRGVFTTIREDTDALNMPEGSTTYSMPAYYGDTRTVDGVGHQEAVTLISSVVGATLVGVDKSDQDGRDYVDMLRTFYHPDLGVAKNTPGSDAKAPGGNSIWYATTANVLYSMLATQYPDATDMTQMQRSIADRYYDMLVALGGADADLTMQDFDFATMTKVTGRNEGGDAAAGTAAILLWAYDAFGDEKYLDGATWAMSYLERSKNLYYEMLPMLAPYVAARLNAEAGTDFDVSKLFATLRAGSDVRKGWGTMEGTWGGYDVSGLSGSRTDLDGYAFAMNSFSTPWVAATARYDARYADAVGRWMLQVSNASRFFYADQMPTAAQQHGDRFVDDPAHVIAYEGIRHQGPEGIIATSDTYDRAGSWGINPETTQLGMYGSSWVGFLGATVSPTNVDHVLRTDLDALDMNAPSPYPTALYYNPLTDDATIDVTVEGDGPRDLYDSVTGRVVVAGATGTAQVTVPAGSSVVLVEAPAGAEQSTRDGTTTLDGVPVRYDTEPQRDLATGADAVSGDGDAALAVDGDPSTAWTTDGSADQELDVDLGAVGTVNELGLSWSVAPHGEVVVETSVDGTTWEAAVDGGEAATSGTATVTPRDARYVRVRVAAGDASEQALASVQVRSRDLALGAPVEVSSEANDVNLAGYLTDDSRWTRWESKASDPQSAQVDLGRPQDLGSVVLRWEAAAARAFEVQVSDDAQDWSTVATVTDGAGGTQVLDLPDGASGRYVRVLGTQRLTKWAYSMHALEVYGPRGAVAAGPAVDLTVEAQARCLAGKAYVAVRAQNTGETPADVRLEAASGSRTVDGVAPGANAYQSFAVRASSVDAGTVRVVGTGRDGTERSWGVAYEAISCG